MAETIGLKQRNCNFGPNLMLLETNYLTFDMQHDHVLKKVEYLPIDPIPRVGGSGGGGSAGKIFGAVLCNRDFLEFDMQHDHVLKK